MKEWLPDQVYRDEAQALEVLDHLVAQYASPAPARQAPYVLGVCLAASGELIGHVGLSPWRDGVEIGYAIGDAHQGRGYAKQAVALAASWSSAELGLTALHGLVAQENVASCKVLEACGFELLDLERRKLHGVERMVKTYRLTMK